MKYQLIEEYFETPLFQRIVQDYFNTVLGKIIAENTTLQAKGYYEYMKKGKVHHTDYYDMPYHIHILNGLIPILFVYEKYLTEKTWSVSTKEVYLKILILGFTFHDANKLLGTKGTDKKGDLEIAVANLDNQVHQWAVSDFFEDFETHRSTIYYLALATEDGTAVIAEDYRITVNDWKEINLVQRELCHLADSLASIQNDYKKGIDHLKDIESIYKAVQRAINNIKTTKLPQLNISYLKVRPNPYTLLSQELLQKAQKALYQGGKKVFYKTREGIIFWGKNISKTEYNFLKKSYSNSEEEVKYISLTTIDAQKCNFDFIGSIPFTTEILEDIITERKNDFLKLSTSSEDKIKYFESFELLLKRLLDAYEAPIDVKINDGRIYLEYWKEMDDEEIEFMKIFNLFKVHWLSASVKEWKKDFNNWKSGKYELPLHFEMNEVKLQTVEDITTFLSQLVNSKGDVTKLSKVILNILKTRKFLNDYDDIDVAIDDLYKETISFLSKGKIISNVREVIFDKYFECLGNTNLNFLEKYEPFIPEKKLMCVFTGSQKDLVYNDGLAFGVRARGFSNRTITSLNNTTGANGVSSFYAEENRLRRSNYPKTIPKRTEKSNSIFVVYNDFFETSLSINQDIINTSLVVKNLAKYVDNTKIQLDENSKFEFNLHNINFVKVSPSVEGFFFFVRRQLLIAQQLGIRSYISGIMTPYQPHKAVFHFENAPRFLKLLGWNNVRLIELEEVLDEISLVLTFGKNRIKSNLLKIAKSRLAYFSLYYKSKNKKEIFNSLSNFYKNYKNKKFKQMTIIEELAELAVDLMAAVYGEKPIHKNSSGASQTWLIRKSTEILRRYVKEGNKPDYIIQTISGEINRKFQVSDSQIISDFAKGFYQKLFVEHWNKKLPSKNIEKEFIYAFAFVFTNKSEEYNKINQKEIRKNYAIKIKNQLIKDGLEITENNIKSILSDKAKKYSNQYLELIKNLK